MEIDYEKAEYVTNRRLENDEGEETGKCQMFSYDNEKYHYNIKCPFCQHEFQGSEELGQRPWWIECPECGRSVNVYRIKDAEERKVKKRGPETPDDVDMDEV